MKKYLPIILFLALMEFQVLSTNGGFSLISLIGVSSLAIYAIQNGIKGYHIKTFLNLERFKRKQRKERKDGDLLLRNHKKVSILILAVYSILVIGSSIIFADFGSRFISILLVTAIGIIGISSFELLVKSQIEEGTCPTESHEKPNKLKDFSIPIIYIYLLNYLLSLQIGSSISFQFILILSGLVLFDIVFRGTTLTEKYENKKISDHDLQHYLFHRWSKYLSFFLTVWYFLILHENGVLNGMQTHIITYIFVVIYITYENRMSTHFSIKNFLATVVFAGMIAFMEPAIQYFLHINPPHYLTAIFLLLFFDGIDQYFHAKEYVETPLKIWEQKAIIYILLTLFIIQLSAIEENPNFTIDTIFSSFTEGSREDLIQNIEVVDIENASAVRE